MGHDLAGLGVSRDEAALCVRTDPIGNAPTSTVRLLIFRRADFLVRYLSPISIPRLLWQAGPVTTGSYQRTNRCAAVASGAHWVVPVSGDLNSVRVSIGTDPRSRPCCRVPLLLYLLLCHRVFMCIRCSKVGFQRFRVSGCLSVGLSGLVYHRDCGCGSCNYTSARRSCAESSSLLHILSH